MTFVVLFVLAVVWAIYLASWLRNRSENRNVDSISSFNKQLSTLERTTPARNGFRPRSQRPGMALGSYGSIGGPAFMSRSQARRRRRDVLFALVGVTLLTLALAVMVGGAFFVSLQLLADLALVGYLGLLVHSQRRLQERRTKVRYLHPMPAQPVAGEVAYLQPASASAN